jgi:hypothetical protein
MLQILQDWQDQGFNPYEPDDSEIWNEPDDSEIWIYCHKSHVSGIQSMLKKLNLKAARYITTDVCDRDSAQWWTRGPVHILTYKLVEGYRYWRRGEVTFSDLIRAFVNDVVLRKG